MRKSAWLDKKINLASCHDTKSILKRLGLSTVCQQARCPNISECFSRKVATFMILGDRCTRNCAFCAVKKGAPGPIDDSQPRKIARAIERFNLSYAVITSPTRDDLLDAGAHAFASVVREVRKVFPGVRVELLIPDFLASPRAVKLVVNTCPEVIGHNLETVASLYSRIRPGADYQRSLKVLRMVKRFNPHIFTKSGIMLGLGEREEEVLRLFDDLRAAGCDFLSLGQYLRPSASHYPVNRYLTPVEFDYFKKQASIRGFRYVMSGPYVRSSYMASDYVKMGKDQRPKTKD